MESSVPSIPPTTTNSTLFAGCSTRDGGLGVEFSAKTKQGPVENVAAPPITFSVEIDSMSFLVTSSARG